MKEVDITRVVRRHLLFVACVTCVTAWFSYVYFHNDEHFQIIEFVRAKRGDIPSKYLPWEHAARMRPWLQPFLYWCVSRVLAVFGVTDIFDLAFAFRLLTGLANVGALALFLRTTVPWMPTPEEKLTHVRVATLAGFLPYLFVRTSSESASMALVTAGFALLLEDGAPSSGGWSVPALKRPLRAICTGLAFGLAFEMRFQTAFLIAGVGLWLVVVARAGARSCAVLTLGVLLALGLGALADRWGYGEWVFPAWRYLRVNIFEGAAEGYGTDPPFAYLWLLLGNVFMPAVAVLLGLAILAWLRCPRHPVTWATLPFFAVHNVIAHKEERFVFPIAVLSTALVTMAIGPSFRGTARGTTFVTRLLEPIATRLWRLRSAWPAKVLAATSFAGMALLAFFPLGWNQHARFMRYVHDRFGDEIVATALPDIDLTLPAFHPRAWGVVSASPEEIAHQIEAGTARRWLIADSAVLRTGTTVDDHAVLVYSELPGFRYPRVKATLVPWVDAYNDHAPARMRRLRFRSLYEIR